MSTFSRDSHLILLNSVENGKYSVINLVENGKYSIINSVENGISSLKHFVENMKSLNERLKKFYRTLIIFYGTEENC